jgi:E3 ubiquitin-protein ligase BIG BROTHER-like protein
VDDEAFARALQEEENARYELERTESRRRGEEWRRQHEEMMFAADDLDELLDEDDEEDLESQDMATAEEDGETEVVADGQLSADSAAAAHRAARREAAQRARARVGQVRPCGAFPNPGTYVI